MKLLLLSCVALGLAATACSGSSTAAPDPRADAMRPVAVKFLEAEQSVNHDQMMSMIDSSAILRSEVDRGCTLTAGCPEHEMANIVTGGSACRDASASESSKGLGAACQFSFRFDQRAKGSDTAMEHAGMCVTVQQKAETFVVMDAYRTMQTQGMHGGMSGRCLPL